jgi:hypothetical protein
MTAPGSPIIRMTGIGGNVTLQDLDLIRDITNASNLVEIMFYSDSILDRCRIGSNWSTPGATGYSNVYIAYPTGIVIRNCVCFSRTPGNFDTAIRAINFNDPANSLFLYNNVVADYRQAGIRIADGAGLAGSLVLLRNNIAVNHVAAAPEPAGYVSEVDGATTIVSSHNTAFATAGLDEALVGAAGSIAGAAAAFLIFPRPAAGATFTSMTWAMAPPWDVNPTLFHLIPGGPLHDGPAKFGQSVGWGNPHARDLAVLRDIDREPRPGGGPPHTDRGVDQLEPGTATHVVAPAEARPLSDARLDAIAIGSPGPSPAIRFAARDAGELRFELFDPEGRRIHTAVQRVRAGSGDLLYLERVARTGVYFYRLVLSPDEGAPAEVSGKVLMVR